METWTTKDGTVMKLSDMTISHLQNCINMLQKQLVDPYHVHGYDPQMGAGGYMDDQIEEWNEGKRNKIKALREELDSRWVEL